MVKPGYKQTEIGVIPEAWEVSSLAAAFPKLEAGVSVNSDNTLSSEYTILKTSAVHEGIVDGAETKPVVPQDYHRVKCPLAKGSIVISRMNTPALVGECGFVKEAKDGVYLPDRLWQVKNPPESDFDFEWLNYLLNTQQYRDSVRATATGTSNSMKNISKERLLEIKIPHPPIVEQKYIASVLADLDELIQLVQKQISKKKALKQGAMQELLTGKKRLPGFSGEWKELALQDYVCCIRGVSYDGTCDVFQEENNHTVRLLRANNIRDARFISENIQYVHQDRVKDIQRLGKTDILVCMANGSRVLVGKSCYLGVEFHQEYTFGAFMSCLRKKDENVDMRYIFNLINSDLYWSKISILFSGSSINNLRPTDILEMRFRFPDMKEQNAISEILSIMDSEIDELDQKLTKYRQLKQGMMQQLLTGKIRL